MRQKLGTKIIAANSPQAKGRVERSQGRDGIWQVLYRGCASEVSRDTSAPKRYYSYLRN